MPDAAPDQMNPVAFLDAALGRTPAEPASASAPAEKPPAKTVADVLAEGISEPNNSGQAMKDGVEKLPPNKGTTVVPVEEPAATATAKAPSTKRDLVDVLIDGGADDPEVEVTDEVKGFFEKHLGAKDVQKYLRENATTREKITALEQELGEARKALAGFEKLPLRLQNTMAKALANDNWEEYLKGSADFDYTKEGKKQDSRSLVDHYFPGVVSQETWDLIKSGDASEADKKSVSTLTDRAIRIFDTDRVEHVQLIENKQKESQAKQKALADSIDHTFAEARKHHKDLAVYLDGDLRKGMSDYSRIFNLFVGQDGTYLPDAARKIALVENIDDVLARVRQRMQVDESRKAVQEATGKLPPTARQAGSSPTTPPVAANAAQEELQKLVGLGAQKQKRIKF